MAKQRIDCPCGASYVSTHGDDDMVAFAMWHVDRIHRKDYPKGLTRQDALKLVKPA